MVAGRLGVVPVEFLTDGRFDHQLSWPRELRLITGRLHGSGQRDLLVGQLAADELRIAFSDGSH